MIFKMKAARFKHLKIYLPKNQIFGIRKNTEERSERELTKQQSIKDVFYFIKSSRTIYIGMKDG